MSHRVHFDSSNGFNRILYSPVNGEWSQTHVHTLLIYDCHSNGVIVIGNIAIIARDSESCWVLIFGEYTTHRTRLWMMFPVITPVVYLLSSNLKTPAITIGNAFRDNSVCNFPHTHMRLLVCIGMRDGHRELNLNPKSFCCTERTKTTRARTSGASIQKEM